MSIQIDGEELLTLTEAARRLPVKNSGRRVHVAAVYRWASSGCRGVTLETIQIGGQRFTSVSALQRFGEELTWRARRAARPARTPDARARLSEIEAAEAAVRRDLAGDENGRGDRRSRVEGCR
jgi:hypothetical protein